MTNLEWLKSLNEKQLIHWLNEEHNEFLSVDAAWRDNFVNDLSETIRYLLKIKLSVQKLKFKDETIENK